MKSELTTVYSILTILLSGALLIPLPLMPLDVAHVMMRIKTSMQLLIVAFCNQF